MKGISMLLLGACLAAVEPATAQMAPVAAPVGTTATQKIPAESFAKLPFLETPRLSPDGGKIAARMAVDGELRLMITDLAKPAGSQALAIPLADVDLNWWTWVNDDWLLAGAGFEEPVDGTPWYLTRTLGISADGEKMKVLGRQAAQNADDVIWVARDGTPRILLSYQTSIYIDRPGFWPQVDEVDVSTGRTKKIVSPRGYVASWYADSTGAVRMGVGYDDARHMASLVYRPAGKGQFRTIDRADRRKDESLTAPQLFLADPTKAVATDSSSGWEALYELDLTTMQLGKKIFDVPGYDLGGIIPDAAGTGLAGVRYTDNRARVRWFDPELARVQAEIDKAVGDRHASIVSMSRDNRKLIVHVGGPDRPGAYYFYDLADGVMKLLAFTNPTLKNAPLSPVSTIRYTARDGLEISAVLTLPKGVPAKALPLIVMPHGGPFVRDREEWDWWAQFLANRGYAVIQPNYRGSSGFGTTFAERGEGQWGLAMQDDLNDAMDWAVKQGIADAKRACIVGASYGGYAAMRAAHRDPGRYRCAISYAGVSDLGSMMRYDNRFLNHRARQDWMKQQAPDFRAVSPVYFAPQFSTPILLMHGKKDRRVQVSQSREMAEKLKQAGKPYIYVEQPLGDHHFSRQADRLDFLQRMEAFLAEHNPA